MLFNYELGQTIVEYTNGVQADFSHFVASQQEYGFQQDKQNNLLYTEAKRQVVFMDGQSEIKGLPYWEFVQDTVKDPGYTKQGYTLNGWYTDSSLNNKWDINNDLIPREEGQLVLFASFTAEPAVAPDLPATIEENLGCDEEQNIDLAPDFEEQQRYVYTYPWEDADGNVLSDQGQLSVFAPKNGASDTYVLTVTATRADNGLSATASTSYTVSRAQHQYSGQWEHTDTEHWQQCQVCGQQFNREDHQFEWIIDKQPTSTTPGLKHQQCTVCGYSKKSVEFVAETDTPNTGDGMGVSVFASLAAAGIVVLAVGRKKFVD